MIAFHTSWTAPFSARTNRPYAVEPFELLTMLLSALSWRRCGHSICMITDEPGAAYYRSLHLTDVWDGGIHATLRVPPDISPFIYWAAGKLFALRQMPVPCVMMDTDFIVWRDIAPLCRNADAAVVHREELLPDIYPDRGAFRTAPDYRFPALDWSARACNTALACFLNAPLRDDYTAHAIDFMRHTPAADDVLTYMVFAEQRMLPMRAAVRGDRLTAFFELPALFSSGQTYFTHVWGYKQKLRDDPAARDRFCRRCAGRLTQDFPYYAQLAARVPSLAPFFL